MKTLIKQTKLNNIRPVLGYTADENIGYFHQLLQIFSKSLTVLAFSEPTIVNNRQQIDWKTDIGNNLTALTQLSEEKRIIAQRHLKYQVNNLYKAVIRFCGTNIEKRHELFETLDRCLEIPSYDDVYIFRDENRYPFFLLTRWGFIDDDISAEKGLIAKLVPLKVTDVLFDVKYNDNSIAPNEEIYFEFDNQKIILTSNEEGKITIVDIPFFTDIVAYQEEDSKRTSEHRFTFDYQNQKEYFTIQLKKTLPSSSNNPTSNTTTTVPSINEVPKFEISPYIRVIDIKNQAVQNATVILSYNNMTITGKSNLEGRYYFKSLSSESPLQIEAKKRWKRGKGTYQFRDKQEEYTIIIAARKWLWPLLLGLGMLVLGAMVLAFCPTCPYSPIAITVVDESTNLPVKQANTKLQLNELVINQWTNENGQALFPNIQLRKDSVFNIIIETEDYETKTVRTICCQEELLVRLTPLPTEHVIPCDIPSNAGGEGDTKNEYNLGQSKGQFELIYDMASVPDELMVYCGRVSKINPQKIIWKTDGAVSGRAAQMIEFNCNTTIVTIRVIGKQEGTSWSYEIKCPD